MKLAICDDDELYRDQLLALVTTYSHQKNTELCISVYDHANALLDAAHRIGGYDIYLLDIIMPDINGIQLGLELRQFDFEGNYLQTIVSAYAVPAW